jgi:hypothetical protein
MGCHEVILNFGVLYGVNRCGPILNRDAAVDRHWIIYYGMRRIHILPASRKHGVGTPDQCSLDEDELDPHTEYCNREDHDNQCDVPLRFSSCREITSGLPRRFHR